MSEERKITVRLPADVHEQLVRAAGHDQRSLNGEIVWMLRFYLGLAASRPDARALIERLANELEREGGTPR